SCHPGAGVKSGREPALSPGPPVEPPYRGRAAPAKTNDEPRGSLPGARVVQRIERYFFSIFRRSISFLSASRFSTLNSTRRFFDMLSADVLGTSGRLEPYPRTVSCAAARPGNLSTR